MTERSLSAADVASLLGVSPSERGNVAGAGILGNPLPTRLARVS